MSQMISNNFKNSPLESLSMISYPLNNTCSRNNAIWHSVSEYLPLDYGYTMRDGTANSMVHTMQEKLWTNVDCEELDAVKCKLNFDSPVMAKQEPMAIRKTGDKAMRINISHLR